MKRLLLFAIFAAPLLLAAQDADPFFAARVQPLLDPSRTGFTPGGSVGLVHQQQWLQMPGAWKHAGVAGALSLKNTKRQVHSWIGIGLRAEQGSQQATSAKYSTLGMAAAAHLRTGSRSFLSAGLGLGQAAMQHGEPAGSWASQYDGTRYNPSAPSGESWPASNRSALEASAGFSFTLKQEVESALRKERDRFTAGVAATHLASMPLAEQGARLEPPPLRLTAYVLGELPFPGWDNGFFAADLIGHWQGPFATGRINAWIGKHLNNSVRTADRQMLLGFRGGLGYRLRDALLVSASAELNSLTFGMAYGWSVLGGDQLAAGRRTAEVMLELRFLEHKE